LTGYGYRGERRTGVSKEAVCQVDGPTEEWGSMEGTNLWVQKRVPALRK